MLYNIANLRDLAIQATEGEIGSVDDMYFDDEAWTVRYLVVDTGSWIAGSKVLVSPISVKAIDWNVRKLALDLTREQIKSAPDVDTAKPVSRQYEARYFRYYARNWLPGKHVLMPTEWVDRVTWSERSVYVNVSRETIRSNPEYDSAAPMDERTVESLMQLGRFGARQAGSPR